MHVQFYVKMVAENCKCSYFTCSSCTHESQVMCIALWAIACSMQCALLEVMHKETVCIYNVAHCSNSKRSIYPLSACRSDPCTLLAFFIKDKVDKIQYLANTPMFQMFSWSNRNTFHSIIYVLLKAVPVKFKPIGLLLKYHDKHGINITWNTFFAVKKAHLWALAELKVSK